MSLAPISTPKARRGDRPATSTFIGSSRPGWSRYEPSMELMIFPIAAVLCVVAAIAFRILGTNIGYKLFFAALAFVLLLKGMG